MSNPSKRKGSGFELECVAVLNAHGIRAIKQPYSGALNNWKGDIEIEINGTKHTIECKRRARAFGTIYGYLGNNHAAILRDDRCPPIVVLRLDDWAKLLNSRAMEPFR